MDSTSVYTGDSIPRARRNTGIYFGPTVPLTTRDSWTRFINAVRAKARQSYPRNLSLAQRILYVHLCLFAKLWFLTQILLPTRVQAQKLTSIGTWFIWQGPIFKDPVTTLQRPKREGGWDLPHVETKCKALLYNRIEMTGAKRGTEMSEFLRK